MSSNVRIVTTRGFIQGALNMFDQEYAPLLISFQDMDAVRCAISSYLELNDRWKQMTADTSSASVVDLYDEIAEAFYEVFVVRGKVKINPEVGVSSGGESLIRKLKILYGGSK